MSEADSAFVHDSDAGIVSTLTGWDAGYCPCPSG
jgi:hypothetical protein|tara:strand:- start:339 stop:440 length:102 start_codon:yes stop_codon:yes gene_type:complete